MKKVKFWTKRLNEVNRMLFSWGRFYELLTKAPVKATVVPLLGAILLQFSALDISDWQPFVSSVRKLAQLGGWPALGAIKVAAVLLLYLYMMFSAIVVGFGFRCKRAIFGGGETVPDPFARVFEEDTVERWDWIPNTNIYQVENRVFEMLHVSKPTEFPLDIVATVRPYFSLVFALGVSVDVVSRLLTGTQTSLWQGVFAFAFWYLVAVSVISGWRSYRERKSNNNW